ncbi:MAG: hypothetical protein ACI9OJ_000593 [Myxococcota bacterium]|jgi:hypothetical protein
MGRATLGNFTKSLTLATAFVFATASVAAAVPVLYGGQNSGSGSGSGGKLMEISSKTGEGFPVGPTDLDEVNGLSCAADGVLYGAGGVTDGGVIMTVDRTTGVGTTVGASGFPALMGLAFSPTGTLFGSAVTAGASADTLVTVDPLSGVAISVGAYGPGIASMDGIAFDSSGVLFGVTGLDDSAAPGPALYTIDTSTGGATLVGILLDAGAAAPVDPPMGLAVLATGQLVASTDDGEILDVDSASGVFTLIGSEIGTTIASLAFCACDPAPVDAGCEISAKGKIGFSDRSDDSRDKLGWAWGNGTATLGAFGDPVAGTTLYVLCAYDDDTLVSSATIPPGGECAGRPCWKSKGTKGFSYSDKDTGAEGISKISFKTGTGRAKIKMKGKGVNLRTPALPLVQSSATTIQLFKLDEPECFQTTFSTPATKNTADSFKDKF